MLLNINLTLRRTRREKTDGVFSMAEQLSVLRGISRGAFGLFSLEKYKITHDTVPRVNTRDYYQFTFSLSLFLSFFLSEDFDRRFERGKRFFIVATMFIAMNFHVVIIFVTKDRRSYGTLFCSKRGS